MPGGDPVGAGDLVFTAVTQFYLSSSKLIRSRTT
jgi:hypothetical protein